MSTSDGVYRALPGCKEQTALSQTVCNTRQIYIAFTKRSSKLGCFSDFYVLDVKALRSKFMYKRKIYLFGITSGLIMMIALCCKLFDNGTRVIIMMVQDNVELNFQNMRRFVQAGIEPAPVWFKDVIEPDYNLKALC